VEPRVEMELKRDGGIVNLIVTSPPRITEKYDQHLTVIECWNKKSFLY
jgi:hypothetical protein